MLANTHCRDTVHNTFSLPFWDGVLWMANSCLRVQGGGGGGKVTIMARELSTLQID